MADDSNRARLKAMRKREQTAFQDWQRGAAARYAGRKMALCLKLARDCSRDSWQHPAHRVEFLRIKLESMQDAREWRDQLREAQQ